MAQGIVDPFEVVEIEREHRQHPVIFPGPGDEGRGPVLKMNLVWKMCVGVMIGQVPDQVLGSSPRGVLLKDHDPAGEQSFLVVDRGGRIRDRDDPFHPG